MNYIKIWELDKIDYIIKNAEILTLNNQNDIAKAVAVKNGKIEKVWLTEPMENEFNEEIRQVDLQGKTLIPGFIDTHNHILSYGLMLEMVDCSISNAPNMDTILERIASKVEEVPEGEWVQGYGYDDTLLTEKRHPTRDDLDKVAPNHPVYLNHLSGHIAVANSKALAMANLNENVEDTSKGQFGRFDDGRLNGVLYEHGAMGAVNQYIPEKTNEEMVEILERAAQEYLAQGITMNTVAAVGMMQDAEEEIQVHINAGKTLKNPMRTQLILVHELFEKGGPFENHTAEELDKDFRIRSDDRVRLDGVKLFQDGSIQGLTAALREPYENNSEQMGALIHAQDVLNEKLLDFHKRGYRIAIHGNGDAAIGSILDAYEFVLKESPRKHHLHRIEHVQTATEDDLDKMQALDVAASFFINHIYYFGDRHEELFLGKERAAKMNPVKSAIDRNILFTLHSDCPITPVSPLFSVWAAVNRVTMKGKVLGENERSDVLNALKSMTIYGAELNFDGAHAGSIEVGKRADFAVLDKNPLAIDPMEIKNITVLETYIDGNIVYSHHA